MGRGRSRGRRKCNHDKFYVQNLFSIRGQKKIKQNSINPYNNRRKKRKNEKRNRGSKKENEKLGKEKQIYGKSTGSMGAVVMN